MKKKSEEPGRHIVDILFVLALFGVFAASALMLVTIGANVYKHTAANMSMHFTERTACSYLTEKLRQNDTADAVSIGELEGVPALILTREDGDNAYCTYLYLYEGYLKELYVRRDSFAGNDILSAGQDIIALSALEMVDLGNGLLRLRLDTGDGNIMTLYATLRADYS